MNQTHHMEVLYNSTRGRGESVRASEAILKGLSGDGGLFVPDHIPVLDKSLREFSGMDYRQVAYEVMKLYLTDFTEDELKSCIDKAYDSKFDTEVIAPRRQREHIIWSFFTEQPLPLRIWRCLFCPI